MCVIFDLGKLIYQILCCDRNAQIYIINTYSRLSTFVILIEISSIETQENNIKDNVFVTYLNMVRMLKVYSYIDSKSSLLSHFINVSATVLQTYEIMNHRFFARMR